MKRRWRLAVVVLTATAVGLLGWACWLEPSSLRLMTYDVHPAHCPVALDGMRIVVLADLHVGSPYIGPSKLDQIVRLANTSDPDLILLLGDYVIRNVVGGHFVSPEEIAARLAPLTAPLGVWAVLGNYDWSFDARRTQKALEDAGIPVLEDRAVPLERRSVGFWLAGVSDHWEGRHDVAMALSAVPADAAVLLFTHNPDIFPEIPARVGLTIAGHTHGGQVNLPFIGPPIVPSRFGQRYAAGLIEEDGHQLFVSTGIGTSIIPVRWRVPPEISLLVVHAP